MNRVPVKGFKNVNGYQKLLKLSFVKKINRNVILHQSALLKHIYWLPYGCLFFNYRYSVSISLWKNLHTAKKKEKEPKNMKKSHEKRAGKHEYVEERQSEEKNVQGGSRNKEILQKNMQSFSHTI